MSNLNMITPLTVQGIINKFCYTIGMLPTSYKQSLSYEEQLDSIGYYLENTVYPAINNNAQALAELQSLFAALQDYVNNYFDNLDVTEEINNKLDTLVENGTLTNLIGAYIQPRIDAQNIAINNFENDVNDQLTAQNNNINNFINTTSSELTNMNNRITQVENGAPLVAASTDDMVDTSKIYVNTTDGKWYYYDGDSWEIGGTYQSTELGENSVSLKNLEPELQKQIVPITAETAEYSITGQGYNGNVGATISTTQANGWWSASMNVNAGDILYVPFIYSDYSWGTFNAIILTNSSDVIQQNIAVTTLQTSILTNKTPYMLEIPNGVSKVYFNNKHASATNAIWYPYIIKSYNYNDKRLTDYQTALNTIEAAGTISSKIYSAYQWDYTLNGFKTTYFSVKPLEKINLTTVIPANNLFCAGIYVDEDIKPVGYLYPFGDNSGATEVTVDDIVPANAKYLYVSTGNAANPVMKKYGLSEVSIPSLKKLTVAYTNEGLTILNNDNGNNIVFKNYLGNDLFMIYSYKVHDTTIITSTDMIPAPYIVEAINDADGDKTEPIFTGGAHQWNNQQSGSTATARQISVAVYCDGTSISAGTTKECNSVKIIEVNRVQAWNTAKEDGTGREVLQEEIVFTFDGTNLNVINTITPLEEILIKTYYGIQTALFDNAAYKIYSNKIYDTSTQLNVTKKPDIIFGGDLISSELYDEGLGDYTYNLSTRKVNISSSKSYYTPILENNTHFQPNSQYYIKGKYTFDYKQK